MRWRTFRQGRVGAPLALWLMLASGALPTLGQVGTPIVSPAVATPAAPGCTGGTFGSRGIGDPYFPTMGNGGYDVGRYDLTLDLDPARGEISDGRVTIAATALLDLCAFNLDFLGPAISEIRVDGQTVTYARSGAELTIALANPLAAGQDFVVEVRYRGHPGEGSGPIQEVSGEQYGEGWATAEREIYIAGQPRGAETWFPVNGHPADKALYTLRLTVPDPFQVVANGELREISTAIGRTTFVWISPEPIASYLVTFHAGDLVIEGDRTPGGVAIRNAFATSVPLAQRAAFGRMPEMIAAFEPMFGPYPFTVAGNTVVGEPLGFALETQTMAIFGRLPLGRDAPLPPGGREQIEGIVAHELAHQWFGNSVGLQRWQDIWLNEGFATYAEALWIEQSEGVAARDDVVRRWHDRLRQRAALFNPDEPSELNARQVLDSYRRDLARPLSDQERRQFLAGLGATAESDLREISAERGLAQLAAMGVGLALFPSDKPLTGDPGASDLFSVDAVYLRGALTLHGLRLEIGDEAFFTLLRTWTERYENGTVTTADFIALAAEVTGRDLDPFFDSWLYQQALPDLPTPLKPIVPQPAPVNDPSPVATPVSS